MMTKQFRSGGLGGLCRWRNWGGVAVAAIMCGTLPLSISASSAANDWSTGVRLQAALRAPVGIAWRDVPLRKHLLQLARVQRVCIFLDRRIDPSQRISFQADAEPLGVALQRLCTQLGTRVLLLDSLVYIGPERVVKQLATTAATRRREAAQLPADLRRRVGTRRPWSWHTLAVPRQLVADLARQAHVSVYDQELVPYDLWPAADWPPLVWSDRMAVVLAGFDLTYQWDAASRGVRIVPFPDSVPAVEDQTLWPAVAGAVPHHNDHRDLDRTRFTLTVNGHPIGAIFQTLQQRSGLVFQIDAAANARLQQVVKFKVTEATVDQLLSAITRPAGLAFKRQGRQVRVFVGE